MRITFIYPIYLWLLILLPLAGVVAWLAYPHGRDLRRWVSLLIRMILMLAIIFSLAGVQLRTRSNILTTVFILDASDSIPPEEIARGEDFIRAAAAAKPASDRLAIVVFGEDALVERLASADEGLGDLTSIPVSTRTNIESALQLAQAILPAEGARRMVLLSDGRENIGSGVDQAELAAFNDTELVFVPLGFIDTQIEVLIDSFEAPSEVRLGERFDLVAVVESTAVVDATLRVFEDSRLIQSLSVTLQPGSNRIRVPMETGRDENSRSGFRRFRAQIIPDADNRLQNNEAGSFTVVYGPPNVLLLESDPADGENFARALEAARMNITRLAPAQAPTTLAELAAYDAVALINVNAADLPKSLMEALPVYVRDLGRGLIMIGGEDGFGAGGYLRTPLESALPVDMDVRDRELQANLALVLAVDKSGSMGRCHCDNPDLNQSYTRQEVGQPKVDIAKEAVMRAAGALGNEDYLGVVAFDSNPHWVLELTKLPDPAAVEGSISAFQAEGQTNLRSGVTEAYRALQGVEARRKHIILMTDGWVRTGELTTLAQEMRDQGITLSIVAAGEGSAEYLAALAQLGGGSWYPATDIFKVPEFFLKETVKSVGEYIIEEPFYPLPSAPSQVLTGLDAAGLPPLAGYNGVTAKNTARLDLLTPRGDPLLATWQYGLGRSAVWTSDLKGRWAAEWIRWDAFPTFAAQLAQWVLPAPKIEGLEAQARLMDGRATVDLQAFDDAGLPLNDLTGAAVLIGPDLTAKELPIVQVGAGRYQASDALSDPGAYLVRVGVNRGDQSLGQMTLGLIVPYSPEYKSAGLDYRLLGELSTITGGGELRSPEAAFEHNLPSAEQAREFWWQLLLLTALLFPLDVILRRLTITRRDWKSARDLLAGKLRSQPKINKADQAPAAVLGQLFQARNRARHRRETGEKPHPSPGGRDHDLTEPERPAPPETADQNSLDESPPLDSLARLKEAKKRARR